MLCGVTCLGMIIAYYGIDNISLTTIRNFAQTDRGGNTINSLCIAAEKLHMNAKGIKCENLGINFQEIEVTADFKIDFLMKAMEEGYNLVYIIQNHNKYINNCIYKFIEDLRDRYEQEDLNEAQTDKCINTLNIIIPKDKRRELVLNIIRECALKNITSYN